MSKEEIEIKHFEEREQWRLCKEVYKVSSEPTISYHRHRRGRKHRQWQVKEDLISNQCKTVLRQAGLWE